MTYLKKLTVVTGLVLLICGLSLTQISCMGENPPKAPFGSTVQIVNPPGDINIPFEGIHVIVVEALVLSPEGQPLDHVLVEWRLFGAGVNDFFFDTDGDGVPDEGGLQLIDVDACETDDPTTPDIDESQLKCSQLRVDQLLKDPYRDAFVDTPFPALTNDKGISEIAILLTGASIFDPTTLEVSLGNGNVASVQITLNTN